MTNQDFKTVIHDTVPVMTGYLVLGAGFGMIMKTNGYGIILTIAMSVFIYAGSMQYAAIGLLTGGASYLTVALTTLAVNARHLFYGISMIDKYKNSGIRKPYLIFALTDETYSLVCTTEKGTNYCFYVSLFNQLYWVCGSIIGSLLGSALKFNTKGIDFSLTALFITIFIDQIISKKQYFSAVTGFAVSVICLLFFGQNSFLIPAMIIITAVLLLDMRRACHVN